MFTPMLFAEVIPPSLTELIPDDILPFQIIAKANEAYEKGEYRKSIFLFKSLKSDSSVVLYDLANAEYKAGMYNEALKHYTQAKGVDPSIRLYNIGNCYFKKGDFKSAIKHYRASLKLKRDDDVLYNLKLAREKRKEKEKQKEKDKKKKEEQKKRDKEKNKKEDEKKKQEDKKKDDRKKESDKKNSKSQKDADASKKREAEKKMTPKEKMRKKELSHLMKQLSKKKMPTMMYQGKENTGERHDKNPW
jgi:Ca-activated chloride channel family protein